MPGLLVMRKIVRESANSLGEFVSVVRREREFDAVGFMLGEQRSQFLLGH
jgi:hypothetical protein